MNCGVVGNKIKSYLANALGTIINPATEEKQTDILTQLTAGTDWYMQIKRGNVPGHSIIEKFGSGNIGTTLVPVTSSLSYQTPTTLTTLEAVSSSANDTAAGTGAQQLTVVGIGAGWAEVTQTVEMNGTTAVTLGTQLFRVYRWWVSRSGTYATQSTGSHAGTLTIRVSGAGATWSTIGVTPFPTGQSQIGCFTVPAGVTGYVVTKNVFAEGSKVADTYFFQRPHADVVTTPFTGAMRLVEREIGISGGYSVNFKAGKGPFVGPCDIGFMSKIASGTDVVSVEFEILLVEDGY